MNMKSKKQRKVWCFNFARRIHSHVGVIQTSYHATPKEAMRVQLKRKEQGWAVWEVTKNDHE
jgi:hypothetical protein